MFPEQFVEVLKTEKAFAVLRTARKDVAERSMEAAIRGGFRVLEFTLTIPGAFDLIEDFSRRKELVVGAGTVLSVADAKRAVESGAVFLVSPILDPRVIAEARALNVAVIPGAHSPTELWQAYQLGAPLQKLFPEPAGGAAYIRSCLSPMPFLRIIPTRGVNESNVAEYLKAGAYAVGFGDTLFPAEAMALEQYDRIERRARILRTAVEFP